MIVLITGASHTGKTLLAQKLLEKYKYPYLSVDHLKMGLIRSGYTDLTPEDDSKLTDYLWPVIREIIKTVIENKQNLIIEGCYIPFDWAKSFEKQHLESIKYYCLVMSEKYIKRSFSDIKKYAGVIENRLNDEDCTIESVLKDNAYYKNDFSEARMHHEIYLSDPRRVSSEKLKTVIRHPVKKKRLNVNSWGKKLKQKDQSSRCQAVALLLTCL